MAEQSLLFIAKSKSVQKAVLELNKLNSDFKEYEERYKAKKDKLQSVIKEYASKNNLEEFGVNSEIGNFKARPVISKKIIWDIDKLKDSLGKELFNEVVDKEYKINDIEGLIDYLKSCGVNSKKFKSFLDVSTKVNNKTIDELAQFGDITDKMLEGCYTLEVTSGYVKISSLEE